MLVQRYCVFAALAGAVVACSAESAAQVWLSERIVELSAYDRDAKLSFGYSVCTVDDVNGDGHEDIVVGARFEAGGRVYLFDGASFAILRTLEPPSPVSGERFGSHVAGMGDMNGDGSGDVLVANDMAEGARVYLYDGASGALLQTYDLSEFEDAVGLVVAAVPDVTGDGIVDVLGASALADVEDIGSAGRAFVFNGATGDLLHALVSPNLQSRGRFGRSVAGLADMDGDGLGDLLIGAPEESVDGLLQAGRAYLFNGSTGELIETMVAPTPSSMQAFGIAVASLPDVSGDGVADFGIDTGSSGWGSAYVYSGSTLALLRTLSWSDGGSGALSSAPDLSGDGVPDIVLGKGHGWIQPACLGCEPIVSGESRAYVYDAVTGRVLATETSPANEFDQFGRSVTGLADADGDNLGEIVVAAPDYDYGNRVYVFLSNKGGGEGEGAPEGEEEGEGEGEDEGEGDGDGEEDGGGEGEGDGEGEGEQNQDTGPIGCSTAVGFPQSTSRALGASIGDLLLLLAAAVAVQRARTHNQRRTIS